MLDIPFLWSRESKEIGYFMHIRHRGDSGRATTVVCSMKKYIMLRLKLYLFVDKSCISKMWKCRNKLERK